jgi:pimeloyl-ACP methyl ester carboxylesterase
MINCRFLVLCLLLAVVTSASSQQVEWKDPSPHAARFITVEEGVQLEVLDWGGSGPAIVLLAGLGDTAHVFDDFAPMLTGHHRVLGITRRGHGRSSAPASGYEFARLAEDVVRVIDTVGVKRPLIAGHSIAGEELHILGSRYSAQIAGVVYIDAAFNRADGSKDYEAVARTLPPAPRPEPADMASFTALRDFLKRTQRPVLPEAQLRARYATKPDGGVGAASVAPQVIAAFTKLMQAMTEAYNPERIRVPSLAIYAAPGSPADLMRPWYKADDPVVRENVPKLYRLARERFGRHAKWFEGFAENGRVSELPGEHHLFITNAREVRDQIEAFMSSLPKTPR